MTIFFSLLQTSKAISIKIGKVCRYVYAISGLIRICSRKMEGEYNKLEVTRYIRVTSCLIVIVYLKL